MPESSPLRPLVPLDVAERLRQIEQSLEVLETMLVMVLDRLEHLGTLVRTDHYGVGRGGMTPEEHGRAG